MLKYARRSLCFGFLKAEKFERKHQNTAHDFKDYRKRKTKYLERQKDDPKKYNQEK